MAGDPNQKTSRENPKPSEPKNPIPSETEKPIGLPKPDKGEVVTKGG